MRHIFFIILFIVFSTVGWSQITIIGHNKINNTKLINTKIIVKDGNGIIQKTETKTSSDFMVNLPFGKNYRIYFQNEISPVIFMEVNAANIPQDKYQYKMTYELNVPFIFKNDEDVDTTVFTNPFHKVQYNGATKMIEDTTYTTSFVKKILKPENFSEDKIKEGNQIERPIIIAGRACINGDLKLLVVNKSIALFNKKGELIKSTKTNRSGTFSFTGVRASDVGKVKLETQQTDLNNSKITIVSTESKKTFSCAYSPETGCEIPLKDAEVKDLIDKNFNYTIGGKLILSSPGKKKFMANKTIYLSNSRNTVIKKTTSSALGTFVFEDIKPDNTYFIGVDANEVGKGEKIDFLNKDDKFIALLDTLAAARKSIKLKTNFNTVFNDISISDEEMRMNVNAKLFGDNTNNPIGKLKILLLNDNYQVIDSSTTDDFGSFKFKYLPFLKRFYLSAENTNNVLDVFNNILVYSNEDNMIKILTHEKGKKFNYKPLATELSKLKTVEMEDPWLEFVSGNTNLKTNQRGLQPKKTIVENVLFEYNKATLLPQAKEILDKVIIVLNTNTNLRIELSAHTDSKGNDADNLKLSEARAKAARDYIAAAGIEGSRIISVGYGESKLRNNCRNNVLCSEIEHAQNRRVEFKILEE